jgi:hypothetical protein
MGPLIDKFESMNYMLWRLKRETMFKAKELWGLIDKIEVKLDKANIIAIATFVKKESQTCNLLV